MVFYWNRSGQATIVPLGRPRNFKFHLPLPDEFGWHNPEAYRRVPRPSNFKRKHIVGGSAKTTFPNRVAFQRRHFDQKSAKAHLYVLKNSLRV